MKEWMLRPDDPDPDDLIGLMVVVSGVIGVVVRQGVRLRTDEDRCCYLVLFKDGEYSYGKYTCEQVLQLAKDLGVAGAGAGASAWAEEKCIVEMED